MAGDDHIKHVVLLMLENRSFDQVLGCFQRKYPDLEGIDPNIELGGRRYNADSRGTKYYQQPGATKQTSHDPRHEVCHVAVQMKNGNTGFVLDYEKDGAAPAELQQVMSYYDYVGDRDLLPASHALADNFTICDRWFSSLPGPTWPNRFFALSGTSSGKVAMPEGFEHPDLKGFVEQTQDTIFDRLRLVRIIEYTSTTSRVHWCYRINGSRISSHTIATLHTSLRRTCTIRHEY